MAKAKQLKTEIWFGAKVDPSVRKACDNITKAYKSLDSAVSKTIKGVAMATAAVGAAAAGALAVAVKAGADFEKQMANVATLLDGDVTKRVDELGDQILDVKKRTKKPIEDLTNGAYQIISAFGDAPDSAEKLEIAAKAAAAGIAETNDAVNLFSAQMKGYGDTSAEFMRQCADMNFQVVKLGQTSFPELAASLPKVIPVAKMMGMTIQEVNGYMATLTGVTGGAAEVATQMSAALTAFLKPTDAMKEKIKALGFADGQAMIQARGLQGSLELLRKTVSTDVEFGNLFGRKEGINFALAATGTLADTVREKTKAMYEASGVMETAFAKQGDNLVGRWKAITNAVETAQIAIGKRLTPVLKELAERALPHVQKWLDMLVAKFDEWSKAASEWVRTIDFGAIMQSIQGAIDKIREWATVIYNNSDTIIAWAKWIGIAMAAIKGISVAIAGVKMVMSVWAFGKSLVMGFVGALSLAKTALVAVWGGMAKIAAFGWAALVKSWTTLQWAWNAAVTAGKVAISGAWQAMLAIKNWGGWVKIWTGLQWAWNAAMSANPIGLIVVAIGAAVAAGWWLYENWDEVCEWCREMWQAFADMFPETAKFIETCWKALCAEFEIAWELVKAGLLASWENIKLTWDVLCSTLKMLWDNFSAAFSAVVKLISGDFEGAKNDIMSIWTNLTEWFNGTLARFSEYGDAIKNIFGSAWENIKEIAKGVIDSIMEYIQPLLDAIKGIFDVLGNVKDGIKNAASAAGDAVKNTASAAWEGTKNIASDAWEGVKGWFASGGFTSGPSICGENGTEAVISFDPAYRAQNQAYLMTAAEMLGMTAAPAASLVESRATTFNLGGITFSPVIKAGANAQATSIMKQLKSSIPDLVDAIEQELAKRQSTRYA